MSTPDPYFVEAFIPEVTEAAFAVRDLLAGRLLDVPPEARAPFIATILASAANAIDGMDIEGQAPEPEEWCIEDGVTGRLRAIVETNWKRR